MTVRAFIVEDEPLAREHLRTMLGDVDWLECVGEAGDGASAIRSIDELRPELIFLDIHLPERSGLDVLAEIRHRPAVIFTTAYDRYAVAAFELQALDYLLKPFGQERFLAAIERARHLLEAEEPQDAPFPRARTALGGDGPLDRIFVRDRGRIVPVTSGEIVRLEAEDDYVRVHTADRKYLVHVALEQFAQRLDHTRFLRVHRSHMVNVDHVRCLEPFDATRLQVEMRDGTRIIASRTRSRELRHLVV